MAYDKGALGAKQGRDLIYDIFCRRNNRIFITAIYEPIV
jgi:hypothetical protein